MYIDERLIEKYLLVLMFAATKPVHHTRDTSMQIKLDIK